MSRYTEQVSSVIKRVVQLEISRGLTDPRIRGIITVTRVDVASDLRDATVWCSVHPWEHASKTMHGLQAAKGHLRSKLSQNTSIRKVPKIWIRLDKSLHKQNEVLGIISRVSTQVSENIKSDFDETEKGDK